MNKPKIIINPSEGFGPSTRRWQGTPGVECTKGGRLWATWLSGGRLEPSQKNFGIVAYSDDSGITWKEPYMVIKYEPKDSLRVSDPQPWIDPDGRLWIFINKVSFPEGAHDTTFKEEPEFLLSHFGNKRLLAIVCDEPDADEPIWSEPFEIAPGFLRNKPCVLSDGEWIIPIWEWDNEDNYVYLSSPDKGKTFHTHVGPAKVKNMEFDENMFLEKKDGSVWFLTRTGVGHIYESFSYDKGKTWTPIKESIFENPGTRFYIGRLKNGNILFVNTPRKDSRKGLVAYISDDDGETWKWSMEFDDRENVSYPDIAEAEDGSVVIIYDRERNNSIAIDPETPNISHAAKEILFARLFQEDIKKGEACCENSVLRQVISKAEIDEV